MELLKISKNKDVKENIVLGVDIKDNKVILHINHILHYGILDYSHNNIIVHNTAIELNKKELKELINKLKDIYDNL